MGYCSLSDSKCSCTWQDQEEFPNKITKPKRKYCYFGAFKIVLSKIMNDDHQIIIILYFHVKYLKIMY